MAAATVRKPAMPEQVNQHNAEVMTSVAAALAVATLAVMSRVELEEQTGRAWELMPLPGYPMEDEESLLPFGHHVQRYQSEPDSKHQAGYTLETDRLPLALDSHPFTFSTLSIATYHYEPARGRYMWEVRNAYVRTDENGYIDVFYDRNHPRFL